METTIGENGHLADAKWLDKSLSNLNFRFLILAILIGWAAITQLVKGFSLLETPHDLLEKLLAGSATLFVSMLTYTGIKEFKARNRSREREEQKQSKKQKSKNKSNRRHP